MRPSKAVVSESLYRSGILFNLLVRLVAILCKPHYLPSSRFSMLRCLLLTPEVKRACSGPQAATSIGGLTLDFFKANLSLFGFE
jgi:hypothetical protein